MELDDDTSQDIDTDYQPIWLTIPRTFEDKRTIEAENFNTLLRKHLNPSVENWECDGNGWTFTFADCSIFIDNDENGTLNVRASSEVMPRKILDGMRTSLRDLLLDPCDLIWHAGEFAVVLLQLVDEAVAWKGLWQAGLVLNVASKGRQSGKLVSLRDQLRRDQNRHWQGFDARSIRGYGSVLDNPLGVNLRSIDDPAIDLLGESIESICSGISKNLRILHVEPVFRSDLVAKFRAQRETIYHELRQLDHWRLRQSVSKDAVKPHSVEDTIDRLAKELSMPTVTFHGAARRSIESIVRYGFVLPGSEIGDTGVKLNIRCGASLGVGIYSSPDSSFASTYLDYQWGEKAILTRPSEVPGMRLIVCATLMGRPVEVSRGEACGSPSILHREAHSHVSRDRFQYIVFNSDQIIPCYVLHLDYGAEMARKEFEELAANPTQFFQRRRKAKTVGSNDAWDIWYNAEPGGNQQKQDALKAAARKWFPYGFGPAQGTSFVIEDMAEHSDDEELYGDFQYQRIEEEAEIRGKQFGRGRSWFDEYHTVRSERFGTDAE